MLANPPVLLLALCYRSGMTRQISVRLTDDEYAALAIEADRIGMTPTGYLTACAREENAANGMTFADVELDRRYEAAQIKRRDSK